MKRPTFKTQNEEIAFTAGMQAASYPVKLPIPKKPELRKAYELGQQYREALFPGR